MTEKEKAPLIDRLARLFLREALSGIVKPVEKVAKRIARAVALILAGITICVLGIAFLAVGSVKWLAVLMPSWLAWIIVGIILLLLGLLVATLTYVSGRS